MRSKLKMIGAMGIFGTIGIIRKFIPYSSALTALVRGVVGTVFLLAVKLIKKEKPSLGTAPKNAVRLGISGAFIGINWILLFEAYRFTSIPVATVCYYMAPVFMIVLSSVFLKEKISIKKWICSGIAAAGMVLVSGVLAESISGLSGVLMGLSAAMMYALAVLINKRTSGISADDSTILQLGAAAIVILPYVLLTEDITAMEMSFKSAALLLAAGVVHTGLAYFMYFDSLKDISAQTAALLSYIDPIVAIILSVLIFKDKLGAAEMIGISLVIGSAAVSEIEFKKIFKKNGGKNHEHKL